MVKKASDKPAKDTIYVDVEDEITSIIDKVEASPEKIVALVLPKKSATLQSIVNMKLLKRSADEAVKNIVLITNDSKILPLAGAAEVHVAKNLSSKPYIPASPVAIKSQPAKEAVGAEDAEPDEKDATLDYHRSIGELAVNEETEEPETISLAEDEATQREETDEAKKSAKKEAAPKVKDKKFKVPNFDKFRLMLVLGIAGLIGLIIFLFLAIKVLPKTAINIKTTSTPVSANFDLKTLDSAKTVDLEKGIIPAVVKTSDQTSAQQVQATGQQNNGNKASGAVTISNCTNSAITVPAGNGISSSGLTFITQKSLSLDSGNFDSNGNCKSSGSHVGSTDVVAQQGGANYNLASGKSFSVSGFSSSVGGTNNNAFTGGTDNITSIVSQADIDNAKSKVTTQSSDDFSKNFQKQLDEQGFYIVASTLKVGDPAITATPAVGQPATTVSVSIKITYSVLAMKKDDLKQIVSDRLKKQIDSSRQQILDSDLLKNVTTSVQNQSSPTNTTLSVTAEASATPNIDVEAIKKQVGGQKSGDIRQFIADIPGVKDVDVKMSPFWVSKAPKNPSKVKVTLQQVNDNNASQ